MAEREFVVDGNKLVFHNYALKFEEKDDEISILGFSTSSEDEIEKLEKCVQSYDILNSTIEALETQMVEYGLAKLSDDNHEMTEFDSRAFEMAVRAMGYLILNLNRLGKIYIPETVNDMPVTSIAEHAFDSTPIGALNAPSVRYIGDLAFCHCRCLQFINFPNVEYIGENAFLKNESLRHIYCPHIEEFAKGAFFDCKALTSVSLGHTLRKIAVGAFNPADRLTIYYGGSLNDFFKVNVEDADIQSPNFSS